jgi:ribonuclease HI
MSKLNFLQWNSRGGLHARHPRHSELLQLIQFHNTHIALLQESSSLSSLSNWQVHTSTHTSIAIHPSLPAALLPHLCTSNDDLDLLTVKVTDPQSSLCTLVSSVYRKWTDRSAASKLRFIQVVEEHAALLSMQNVPFVIAGDFNIKASFLGSSTSCNVESRLLALSTRYFPGLLNDTQPTWYSPQELNPPPPSVLDLTLASIPASQLASFEFSSWTIRELLSSDHCPITFCLESVEDTAAPAPVPKLRLNRTPPPPTPSLPGQPPPPTLADTIAIQIQELHSRDRPHSPELLATELTTILRNSALYHQYLVPEAPSTALPTKNKGSFGWNKECQRLARRRKKLFRALKQDPISPQAQTTRAKLNKTRRDLHQAMVLASKERWRDVCSKVNSATPTSDMWRRFKHLSTKSSGKAPSPQRLILHDGAGQPILDQQTCVDHIATHICNISTPSAPSNPQHYYMVTNYVEQLGLTETVPTSPEEATSLLNALPPTGPSSLIQPHELAEALGSRSNFSAPGPDNIFYKLIKDAGESFHNELLYLFNLCLATGSFPSAWKHAIVIPLVKDPKKTTLPSHYRPISLVSVLGKLLERIIGRRLCFTLDLTSPINPHQFGFRQKSGTTDSIFHLLQDSANAWKEGEDVAAVFLDVEKAFDTAWRDAILFKLHRSKGLDGPILRIIADFLRNRTFAVHHNGFTSRTLALLLGVPQGCVLSPLLYNIFTDDLLECIPPPVKGLLYADDCAFYTRLSRSPGALWTQQRQLLQAALDAVTSWFSTWGSRLSPTKSILAILAPPSSPNLLSQLTVALGSHLLTPTSTAFKYLGLLLDPSLTLSQHIDAVCERVAKRAQLLRFLSGLSWGPDVLALRQLYTAWIRPVLEYGAIFLMGAPRGKLALLDLIQTQCTAIILGCTGRASRVAMEVHANLPPLGLRRAKLAARYASSLRRLPPNHPTRKLLEHSQATIPHRALRRPSVSISKPLDLSFSSRAKSAPSPTGILLAIESELQLLTKGTPAEPFLFWPHPPWQPPPSSIHSARHRWPALGSAGTRNTQQTESARAFATQQVLRALSLSQGCPSTHLAFTDGSASSSGGGAGVAIYSTSPQGPEIDPRKPTVKLSVPLGQLSSNSLAELYAIILALEAIANSSPLPLPGSRVWVLSDSQFAVTAAETGHLGADSSYWMSIRKIGQLTEQLSTSQIEVQFDWIPGHCQFLPNNLADRLAGEAMLVSSCSQLISPVPLPHQLVKRCIAKQLAGLWDRWWFHTKKAPVAHQCHSQASWCFPFRLLDRSSRKEQVILSRLIVGNATNNRTLSHVTDVSPQCPCGATDATHHRLFACTNISPQRQTLRIKLQLSPNTELSYRTLLHTQHLSTSAKTTHLQAVLAFISSAKLDAVFIYSPPALDAPASNSSDSEGSSSEEDP